MSRRRLFDFFYDLLLWTPVWFGPTLAVAIFCLLHFIVPPFLTASSTGVAPFLALRTAVDVLAIAVPLIVLVAWLYAMAETSRKRRLLNTNQDIESIRRLSWSQFEEYTAEAFRRQGYFAKVVGNPAGDGGIDIILHKDGRKTLVQCKHWKAWKVSVTHVRELLGVVTSEKAARGILVTTGYFTREAQSFASKNAIHLISGPALVVMTKAPQLPPVVQK